MQAEAQIPAEVTVPAEAPAPPATAVPEAPVHAEVRVPAEATVPAEAPVPAAAEVPEAPVQAEATPTVPATSSLDAAARRRSRDAAAVLPDDFVLLLATAGVSAALAARLARYAAMVLEANTAFNLTGAKSAPEIVEHIRDSLSVAPYVSGSLVDVGSGAGFPAIPVAIATGVPVTLVEASAKKARFLRRVLDELRLAGEVVAERAEVAARTARLRDAFDCGTARAVASATAVAELVLPFVKPGGAAILQRGSLEERERHALADAALVLAAEFEREASALEKPGHAFEGSSHADEGSSHADEGSSHADKGLSRAFEGSSHAFEAPVSRSGRRIVVLRKRGPTPERFPRRNGIPQKRPLCE